MINVEFTQELKSTFERMIQLKERLDTKANNMITMSGTIATLFMGFGIFLLSNIGLTNNWTLGLSASLLIIAEIFLTFCTIRSSLDSYKLRNYVHPITSQRFFKENEIEPDKDEYELFENANSDDVNHHLVREYLKSIRSYEVQNREQTIGINRAQKTFLWSLVMIPIFSILVIAMMFFK